jgi:hypothetical protein
LTELEILHGVLNNPAMANTLYSIFAIRYPSAASGGGTVNYMETAQPDELNDLDGNGSGRAAERKLKLAA